MMNALARNFQISCAQHVILNGRSVEPRPTGTEARKLQAISAGRLWDEGKNIAILSNVRAPFPILLAGDQHREGIAAPPFRSSLTLLGKLSETELLAAFRASSIYLATSIYEPFGLAPLEAALCGCAVVANDIPPFREAWGEAALYFTGSESLSRILTSLHESPETLNRSRQSCRRRALELTRARMAEAYVALYTELASHPQQSPVCEPAAYA